MVELHQEGLLPTGLPSLDSLNPPLGRFSLYFVMSMVVSVDLFVPLSGTQNQVDWRLLVKERVTKIAKLRNPFLEHFDN